MHPSIHSKSTSILLWCSYTSFLYQSPDWAGTGIACLAIRANRPAVYCDEGDDIDETDDVDDNLNYMNDGDDVDDYWDYISDDNDDNDDEDN